MLKSLLRLVKIKLVLCIEFLRRIVCGRGSGKGGDDDGESGGSVEKVVASVATDINFDRFVVVQGGGDVEEAFIARSDYLAPNVGRQQHYQPPPQQQQQLAPPTITGFGRILFIFYSKYSNLYFYLFCIFDLTLWPKDYRNIPAEQHESIPEPEPDFFSDMVPQFKRPKTVSSSAQCSYHLNANICIFEYFKLLVDIEQSPEESAEEMQRKFRFNNRVVELNDERFVDFGNIDGVANTATTNNNNVDVGHTAWGDEDAWDGLAQAELEHQAGRRQQKRPAKQSSRPKVARTLGATKKEAID